MAPVRHDEGHYGTAWSVGQKPTPEQSTGPVARKQLLDINELEAMYGLKRWMIRQYCSQGKIPFLKIGGRVYFEAAEIEAWIQAHARPVKEVHIP